MALSILSLLPPNSFAQSGGKKKKKLTEIEGFAIGGTAAGISKTVAAPIERVKLMVQNQDEMIKQGRLATPYKGVIDCFRRTMAEEGPLSFWRGNWANVLRYFPTQALNFMFKDSLKAMFPEKKEGDSVLTAFGRNMLSGGAAGALSLSFVYSLDFARTRLANDNKSAKKGGGERQFNGLIDVYRKTMASDGIAGLYRGFVVSCVGIVIYRGCYFGFFDTLKPILLVGKLDNFWGKFLLGYVVTITAGIASYPLDTIRRRMMMTSGAAVKYKNSMDCTVQILKNEGVMSMFKGAGANVLRGIAGGLVLSGFDTMEKYYIDWKYGKQ